MYKIEKDVPTPEKSTTRKKYPWEEMDIGDSVFVPRTDAPYYAVASSAYNYATRARKTFRTHRVRGEQPGTRVWRTA